MLKPPKSPAAARSVEPFSSIDAVTAALATANYISTPRISTAIYLARAMHKPVLIEGPAGVGKTDLAISVAAALEVKLLRLQCYEGLDDSKALYEWKYGKQLLYTQILKDKIGQIIDASDSLHDAFGKLNTFQDVFFSREFLEARPILQAMEQPDASVLLIDEVDKSEEAFEAMLLEVLGSNQITIPEIGTIRAAHPPLVLLTSNSTRELSDALKRRCLHLYIGFPDAALERRIVQARIPDVSQHLLAQMVTFVQSVRAERLRKVPSVAETIDWARALILLNATTLDETLIRDTLNVLMKRESDIAALQENLPALAAAAIAARPA